MTVSTTAQTTASPPPERPGDATSEDTAHTDPGPSADAPRDVQDDERDWSDADDRYEMIAEAAYYKAEQRGFELGYEDMDWIEAEQELLERMGREPVY